MPVVATWAQKYLLLKKKYSRSLNATYRVIALFRVDTAPNRVRHDVLRDFTAAVQFFKGRGNFGDEPWSGRKGRDARFGPGN